MIAITQGDSAGIGPEIIVKTFAKNLELTKNCFVIGEFKTFKRALKICSLNFNLKIIKSLSEINNLTNATIPILQPQGILGPNKSGKINKNAGISAYLSIIKATELALKKEISAIVTAPINKESLNLAGIKFPGHTEILQFETAKFFNLPIEKIPVRMMLANEELKVVLVTIHIALREAINSINFENVLETIKITNTFLTKILKKRPKIAVAALNPHAGENGLFGLEELEILIPAINQAKSENIEVFGPFSPDTIFSQARAKNNKFDVVIAMYHDQGLIPIKYLGIECGVNITLGLPFIRTSPDHGTAFDLAGTGKANEESLIYALKIAKDLI